MLGFCQKHPKIIALTKYIENKKQLFGLLFVIIIHYLSIFHKPITTLYLQNN